MGKKRKSEKKIESVNSSLDALAQLAKDWNNRFTFERPDLLKRHRRLSNGELSRKKLALAMAHPVSRMWAGSWQRNI